METVLNNFCAEGLNVLSLFDGMSCGQLALQKAGIKVNQYYAAEIDKYAMQVTQKNFPNTIQLGDVTKVKGADLPKIDLIIGGSPCQGFSFAGKGLNFEDERSKLFFEFVRLINECKPKWFFLENVKMKKEHELVISQYMKVAPIEINSALVSAQNRVRLYWTNINEKPYGLFGDMMADIPQPKDKGILLKDILQSDAPDKYFLSSKMIACLKGHERFNKYTTETLFSENKSSCLNARLHKMGNGDTYIKIDKKGNTKHNQDKASCFTAGGNSGGNHSDMDLIVENENVRRLTPTECERLQTVPDGYTDCVSDTQRYRMLGNGWTVDVIAHFFVFLKEEKKLFKTEPKCLIEAQT